MLTSQSILFAITMFATQSAHPWLAILSAYPALLLNKRWGPITESRGLDVFYFQWQMLQIEAQVAVDAELLTGFKAWQRLSIQQRRERLQADSIGRELLGSNTRKALDITIPLAFRWCSIFLLGLAVYISAERILGHFNLSFPWAHWLQR
jgi:hypothetical protein